SLLVYHRDNCLALLHNDAYLRSHLPGLLSYLRIYCRNYSKALDAFLCLQSLSKCSKKSKRILYLSGLEKNFFETDHYKFVIKQFKKNNFFFFIFKPKNLFVFF